LHKLYILFLIFNTWDADDSESDDESEPDEEESDDEEEELPLDVDVDAEDEADREPGLFGGIFKTLYCFGQKIKLFTKIASKVTLDSLHRQFLLALLG
jgi:hypothetical protein